MLNVRGVTFDAVVNGPPATSYRWEFGDGNVVERTQEQGAGPVTHEYLAITDETYTVTLTVFRPTGDPMDPCLDTDSIDVDVPGCGCPQIISITSDARRDGCTADGTNRVVVLDAEIAAGSVSSYEWDFGDGQSETIDGTVPDAPRTSHPYGATSEQTYMVKLTARGQEDCEDTAETAVVVAPCDPPPPPDPPPDPTESTGCLWLRWIIVILLAVAVVFVAATLCVPELDELILGILIGIAIGLALGGRDHWSHLVLPLSGEALPVGSVVCVAGPLGGRGLR